MNKEDVIRKIRDGTIPIGTSVDSYLLGYEFGKYEKETKRFDGQQAEEMPLLSDD